MTEAKQQKAGWTRFLLLPPLSAAEREAERESERKLSVVLVEMFGGELFGWPMTRNNALIIAKYLREAGWSEVTALRQEVAEIGRAHV